MDFEGRANILTRCVWKVREETQDEPVALGTAIMLLTGSGEQKVWEGL